LKNNRGINDGADLPEGYMTELYDRILTNEIKMKARVRTGVHRTEPALRPLLSTAREHDSPLKRSR